MGSDGKWHMPNRLRKPQKPEQPKTETTEGKRNVPYTFYTGQFAHFPAGTTINCSNGWTMTLEKDAALYTDTTQKKTLYDGRYCAVSAFVFAVVDGRYSVLANQRGEGTPDYQGCWNCPCGFLEANEDSRHGASREIYEETMEGVAPWWLDVVYVETEPEKCNNGNVTIRHRAFIGKQQQINKGRAWTVENYGGGEKDEVKNVKWIPVDDIHLFDWAFHHEETILELAPPKWKRRLIEWEYNIFYRGVNGTHSYMYNTGTAREFGKYIEKED